MKNIRTILITALLWLGAAGAALAQQSSPNWSYGYTPTPAEWNHWFAVKTDWPGAASCTVTGCTLTGPLVTTPSTTLSAGFNVPPGVAPTTPNAGDIWSTTAPGLFFSVGGQSYNLLSAPRAPGGRLTLQAHLPVMLGSFANQGTLYYVCSGSTGGNNAVYYFDGTQDMLDLMPAGPGACQYTDVMVSTATAGQVVANNLYDVWWVHNGTNKICLAMSSSTGGGGGWASDAGGSNVSRGTGYTQLDYTSRPYVTNLNAITNCFNGSTNYGTILARQGTYLGTIWATANGQSSYIYGGASSGGTAAMFGVCNPFNQTSVASATIDNGSTYTYTTATIRQARGSTGMQISVVNCFGSGGGGMNYDLNYNANLTLVAAAGAYGAHFIGLDSITVGASVRSVIQTPAAFAAIGSTFNSLRSGPSAGFHYFSALEVGDGTNANTFNSTVNDQFTITFQN